MKIFLRIPVALASLLLGIILWAGSVQRASAEDSPGLPPGPNRQLVEDTCTACHSAKIILQNRMTRQRWDETISWMQMTQGLWELAPEDRAHILDYLSTVRGPAAGDANSTAASPHPMYEFDYPPNPL